MDIYESFGHDNARDRSIESSPVNNQQGDPGAGKGFQL
jgi:hypothetical protein